MMNKLLITLALITELFSTQSWSADFNKGFIAYDSGDFETAINEWTPLAHDGDAEACLLYTSPSPRD